MRTISLMYHDVVSHGAFDSSGFLFPGAYRYKLDKHDFELHLAAIASALRSKVTISIEARKEPQKRQLVMTFDDGGVSCLDPIADMLERYAADVVPRKRAADRERYMEGLRRAGVPEA